MTDSTEPQVTQADVTDEDKAAVTRFHGIQIKRILAGDSTLGEGGRQTIEQAFAERRLSGIAEGLRLATQPTASDSGMVSVPREEWERAQEELDRFRRPAHRSLSTNDPIVPLPGFQPRYLLGQALLFREWCDADLWGRPQEAELAARLCETAYHLLTAAPAPEHPTTEAVSGEVEPTFNPVYSSILAQWDDPESDQPTAHEIIIHGKLRMEAAEGNPHDLYNRAKAVIRAWQAALPSTSTTGMGS